MARAIAMCRCEKCGKEFQKINYLQNRKSADEWQKWAEANITFCEDCYKEEREAERKAADEKAAKENAELGLPALVGSEKQIAWAEKIRRDFVVEAEKQAEENEEMFAKTREEIGEQAEEQIESMRNIFDDFCAEHLRETSAKAWIEKRDDVEFFLSALNKYAAKRMSA